MCPIKDVSEPTILCFSPSVYTRNYGFTHTTDCSFNKKVSLNKGAEVPAQNSGEFI